MTTENIRERLEYLRGEIRAERISYSELGELQGLADQIDPWDNELLEWAGVPEAEAMERQRIAGSTTPEEPSLTPIQFANVVPAPSGFGLYQLTPWEGNEFCPNKETLDEYAGSGDPGTMVGDYTLADSPGEGYKGLIQGESDADGWLIPDTLDGDRDARPIAWRET